MHRHFMHGKIILGNKMWEVILCFILSAYIFLKIIYWIYLKHTLKSYSKKHSIIFNKKLSLKSVLNEFQATIPILPLPRWHIFFFNIPRMYRPRASDLGWQFAEGMRAILVFLVLGKVSVGWYASLPFESALSLLPPRSCLTFCSSLYSLEARWCPLPKLQCPP